MRLKVFIGTTFSALVATLASPVAAQAPPGTDSTRPDPGSAESDPPAAPPAPSAPAPTESASPVAPEPPSAEAPPRDAAGNGVPSTPASADADDDQIADTGTTKIGASLSPLVVNAALGYAVAAVTHPDLVSHTLSGAFLEVSAGTELDAKFRLSLSFTSFETKIRRTRSGKFEEGEYVNRTTAGLHALADPIDATVTHEGGVEVQKTFHAHSLGPRMDFLPLGSQGPYLGMTAGVAVIQDVATRVGGALAARIGAEWRPFHSLGLAIEAGAHGQIYTDSTAAIPYATARLTLLLEPANLRRSARPPSPSQLPRSLSVPR